MKGRLPHRTVFLWQARLAVLYLAVIALLCYFSFLTRWLYLAAVVLTVLSAVAVIWYIPSYFKSYEIRYINDAIIIKRGIFFRSTHIMPFSRLIYAKTFATPLARIFKLSALVLKAARSGIFVPELNADKAKSFIEYISRECAE